MQAVSRILAGSVIDHSLTHLIKNGSKIIHLSSAMFCVHYFASCRKYTSKSQQTSQELEPRAKHHRDHKTLQPMVQSQFNALIDSAKQDHKDLASREQFSFAVDSFLARERYRKGHVGFVRVALQRMDEFGLENDLTTYNKLLQVFPKGRFKPRRMIDALWPRSLPQMELALELLTKMEDNGVNPSLETYQSVKDVFGGMSFPLQKCIRMMYLFDKYENADPYRIKGELPTSPLELAKLTLKRIAGNDGIIEHKVPSDDNNITDNSPFLLSASTESQVKLLRSVDKPEDLLFHVEGPHRLWLRKIKQHYFSLKLSRRDTSSLLKDEGAVLGVCMCHPANQESLQDWLGALQQSYPSLAKATVVYNIRRTETEAEQSSNDTTKTLPPHRTSLSSGEPDATS